MELVALSPSGRALDILGVAQQPREPEDPFTFLFHRVAQARNHGIVPRERLADCPQDSVRAVVPHGIGRQHHLDGLAIDLRLGGAASAAG